MCFFKFSHLKFRQELGNINDCVDEDPMFPRAELEGPDGWWVGACELGGNSEPFEHRGPGDEKPGGARHDGVSPHGLLGGAGWSVATVAPSWDPCGCVMGRQVVRIAGAHSAL